MRIAQAAAGLAYYALCVRRAGNSDGVESFKAGDITVKKGADSSLKFAASVRDSALAELTPLLSDDGFSAAGWRYESLSGIQKWGRTLVIENTDSTRTAPFKGFIQPLRYKTRCISTA